MNRIEQYKADMIARKAARAGMSVAAFVAKGERDASITRRVNEIRCDRTSTRPALIWHCVERAIRDRRTHEFNILTAA